MSKKLAVVISGAVSLGSFEAGVIYEVLEAIARHNESLSENSENDENRIEIDVITGASAGGMTACILAQNLLYDDGSLREPYENSLYKAWVEKVDIVPLLKVAKEDQHISLLNKGVVERIAAELLQDKEEPKRTKHPAASSKIQIGVAMSNLNGFNYQVKTSQNQTFAYTRFKDQFVCSVRREENGDAVLKEKKLEDDTWEDSRDIKWSDLREAGISSGAFPLAFPMRSIFRVGEGKFSTRDSKNKNDENPDSVHKGNYLYTDGGVFENEPVGMARALVDQAQEKEDNVTRYYLLVKPGERKASEDPFLNQEQNLLTTAIALFGAIFQQAQFQDWIMKEIDSPLLTITSNDSELIGDVFSAFSGFLEEKFRAYDYNIGRERAREQLKEAHRRRLLSFDPNEQGKMPPIEWKVAKEKSVIGGETLTQWEDVKSKLGELAKEIRVDAKDKDKVIVDDQGDQWKKGKRSQLKELHRLMHEVKPETRKEICEQLKERLGYLVDFINDKYLAKADKQNPVGVNLNNLQFIPELIKSAKASEFSDIDLDINFKLMAREAFGKPLAKIILVGVLDFWLEKNILNPP
ncbi:MAG: patatin-like phospholipase family protein [Microcystis sp.]|uniref:patatin-like phospholipase family protein n=1 Tax=Microcystis sp. TaxID=1127 RepID=UPI003918BDB9